MRSVVGGEGEERGSIGVECEEWREKNARKKEETIREIKERRETHLDRKRDRQTDRLKRREN